MSISNKKLQLALETYKQIDLLSRLLYLADWDMQTYMPPRAAKGRANQVAYLTEIIVDKWLDPEFKHLVEELEKTELSSEETAMVRNLARMGKIYFKTPKKLLIERARLTSEAVTVWQEAKSNKNYKLFEPYLKKICEMHQEIAEHLGYKDHPYDALLDLYEPGLTTSEVSKVFAGLQEPLTTLHKRLLAKKKNGYIKAIFDKTSQEKLGEYIMKLMNFDTESGRLDQSAHPFCTTLDNEDVRITTKYHEDDMRSSIMSVMHETGHALYEQGLPEKYENTPLSQAASYGIHESQSRLWENMIGRSSEYLVFIFPELKKKFPKQFSKLNIEDVVLYLNEIKNTPIRIESDEVAYNLHIILRFNIEKDIIARKVNLDDLPEVWNSYAKELLGVTLKDDSLGILQDVHWSSGNIGYFPTYALGNIYAAQIFAEMETKVPIKNLLTKGDLKPILSWLRKNIHQYGSLYDPEDLILKATGKKLDPSYFMDYITKKYSDLYNF